MDRVVLVARLKPGAEGRAAALVGEGPPFDPAERGLSRHTVYLSAGEVVFVFEGDEVEWIVEEMVYEPAGRAVASALERGESSWRASADRADGLLLGAHGLAGRLAEDLVTADPTPADRRLAADLDPLEGGTTVGPVPGHLPDARAAFDISDTKPLGPRVRWILHPSFRSRYERRPDDLAKQGQLIG